MLNWQNAGHRALAAAALTTSTEGDENTDVGELFRSLEAAPLLAAARAGYVHPARGRLAHVSASLHGVRAAADGPNGDSTRALLSLAADDPTMMPQVISVISSVISVISSVITLSLAADDPTMMPQVATRMA